MPLIEYSFFDLKGGDKYSVVIIDLYYILSCQTEFRGLSKPLGGGRQRGERAAGC